MQNVGRSILCNHSTYEESSPLKRKTLNLVLYKQILVSIYLPPRVLCYIFLSVLFISHLANHFTNMEKCVDSLKRIFFVFTGMDGSVFVEMLH